MEFLYPDKQMDGSFVSCCPKNNDRQIVFTQPRPEAVFARVENFTNSMAALCRLADVRQRSFSATLMAAIHSQMQTLAGFKKPRSRRGVVLFLRAITAFGILVHPARSEPEFLASTGNSLIYSARSHRRAA